GHRKIRASLEEHRVATRTREDACGTMRRGDLRLDRTALQVVHEEPGPRGSLHAPDVFESHSLPRQLLLDQLRTGTTCCQARVLALVLVAPAREVVQTHDRRA